MTKRLREVVEALEKLPENEQNSIAEELVRKLAGAGGRPALGGYEWLETLEHPHLDGPQDASVSYEDRLYRLEAVVLEQLRNSPSVDVIPVGEPLFDEGLALFRSRGDKAWSLTDCISFVVMHRRNIGTALTADKHFEQAGFEILLK